MSTVLRKMASSPRLSDSLQRFRLDGIRDTGITVGEGAYATVLQYDFRGLKCVGKKIHRLLYENASPAHRTDMLRRFEEECELLGRLHHPNIVQFLGVHMEKGSEVPALVMEYLPTNLSSFLDEQGALSDGYWILRDVALGLRYLHEYSPPIVHRDLSANNVLLTTSLSAKISDLGVAKILNITPSKMTQKMSTKAPGTPCYMPPEALAARPSYTRKIDSYSFGVMILHVLCGKWPFPTDPFQRDPQNPDKFIPVTEVNRRAEFMQLIGSDHPLSGLVRQCLSNAPNERPESAYILMQINAALSRVPPPAQTMYNWVMGLANLNKYLRKEIRILRKTQPSSSGAAVDQPPMCDDEGLATHDLGPPVTAAAISAESQAPEWQLGTKCAICSQEFNKFKGWWRHHCRNCGQSVCSSCSSKRLALPHYGLNQPTKVCDVCFKILDEGKGDTASKGKGVEDEDDRDLPLHLFPDDAMLPQLDSEYKLKWHRRADTPVGMVSAQAVVVGGNVYVGGGTTTDAAGAHQVFLYNWEEDEWSTLPQCPVRWFGMAHFMGRVITVGGKDMLYSSTGKVHMLKEEPQQWEEFLIPMPTSRYGLSVTTTSEAIIASGGETESLAYASTVEVYTSNTSQWHTADPLPIPHAWMSSVTISNTCYLLGGAHADQNSSVHKNCWCAFLPSLIHKAVSSTHHPVCESVWSHLPPSPLKRPSAACAHGSLIAIGGINDDKTRSSSVYAFLNNSWVRLREGSLLSPQSYCATAQLSPGEVIVIGGYESKTVCIGTVQSGCTML